MNTTRTLLAVALVWRDSKLLVHTCAERGVLVAGLFGLS